MVLANNEEMNLAELAAATGVPGRTIRFYISRGLLAGPSTAGRGASYTREHRERIELIKQLQARGLTLTEIARTLGGDREKLPSPVAWWNYPIADDVVVMVKADAAPWRLRQVRTALAAMAASLRTEDQRQEE